MTVLCGASTEHRKGADLRVQTSRHNTHVGPWDAGRAGLEQGARGQQRPEGHGGVQLPTQDILNCHLLPLRTEGEVIQAEAHRGRLGKVGWWREPRSTSGCPHSFPLLRVPGPQEGRGQSEKAIKGKPGCQPERKLNDTHKTLTGSKQDGRWPRARSCWARI